MSVSKIATCIAPVNIAVIKYWGKRDENLILPLNDSLSGTLSTDQMCAKTTVAISSSFTKDRMWLNGVEEETTKNPRLRACIQEIKRRANEEQKLGEDELSWNVHICSENNFPTAAGLASSAAGYACLVYSLAQLYEISGDISAIARQGSGSACRSVYGGFVAWISGVRGDGVDSIAKQLVPANHWPEMRVLILVVSDSRKKTSSTSGMQRSVQTSELMKYRVEKCVPERMAAISNAILTKDFETFAEITMKDSNQFHGICLDTFPTCVYMNDVSHGISHLIHRINALAGKHIVAYTFDAGPNVCLYLLEKDVPLVLASVNKIFPTKKHSTEYTKGIPVTPMKMLPPEFEDISSMEPWPQDSLRYIIHTKIGEGPTTLSSDLNDGSKLHLMDSSGLPKSLTMTGK